MFFRCDFIHAPIDKLHHEQAEDKPQRDIHKQVVASAGNIEYIEDTPPIKVTQCTTIPKINDNAEGIGKQIEKSKWNDESFDFLIQESWEWFFFEEEAGKEKEKSVDIGYVIPLRVYGVTPYNSDNGNPFYKIDVIDSFWGGRNYPPPILLNFVYFS